MPQPRDSITSTDGYTLQNLYYSGSQLTETRVAGTTTGIYLWSVTYIDALVSRENASGTLYATYDANFDVTSIEFASTVQERFVYTAGGTFTVENSSWSGTSDSKNWIIFDKGMEYETSIGWYMDRARIYSPTLQVFGQSEPSGGMYVDGMALQQAFGDNPINHRDSTGEKSFEFDPVNNTATLTIRLAFNWKDDGNDKWTEARKQNFQNTLKSRIEAAFNGTQFKIYAAQKLAVQYNSKGRPINSETCIGQDGITPLLKIEFGDNPDFRINATADVSQKWEDSSTFVWPDVPSWFRLPSGDWNEGDSILVGGQIGGAHEFGHLIGLHHPGQDQFPPAWPNSDDDYNADKKSLMGGGMEMRPQYFQPWADQLHYMYSRRLYSASFTIH